MAIDQILSPAPIATAVLLRNRVDVALATIFAVLSSLLYGILAWPLTQGHFFESYNLLFDMDAPAYLHTYSPPTGFVQDVQVIIKHPLVNWLGVFALPWTLLGFSPVSALTLASAMVGGATNALFFCFARLAGSGRLDAILVTSVFALGATHLLSSMIVETYPYAALSLGLMWCICALRNRAPQRARSAAIASAVFTFGVTITNVIQTAIVEFVVQYSRSHIRDTIRAVFFFGAIVAALSAVCVIIAWPTEIIWIVNNPVASLKLVYWGIPRTPKTGIWMVVLTFLGYTLAAPQFTPVPLARDGIVMFDFRHFDMPFVEAMGLLLWLALLGVGVVIALRNVRTQRLTYALLATVLFNLCLHVWIQYRESLFLYTEHAWFAVAALAAVGMASLNDSDHRLRWCLRSTLLAVILATAPFNLERAKEAGHLFDMRSSFEIPSPQRAQ